MNDQILIDILKRLGNKYMAVGRLQHILLAVEKDFVSLFREDNNLRVTSVCLMQACICLQDEFNKSKDLRKDVLDIAIDELLDLIVEFKNCRC